MKKRSTLGMSVKTKTTIKRYLLVGSSLMIAIAFVGVLFFYLRSNEEARASSQAKVESFSKTPKKKYHRPGKSQKFLGVLINMQFRIRCRGGECKPRGGYNKESFLSEALKKKSPKTPYKYVYISPDAAPPKLQTIPSSITPPMNDNDLVASLNSSAPTESKSSSISEIKAPSYSSLKYMSVDQRKKAIQNLPASKELPALRFLSDQDEFSVVNMDSFMEALEMINQGKMVLVEGHTDDLGSNAYNLKLSMKRVEKIRQLMLQAGANDNLISIIGYGEEKPIVPNTSDANREINRRIEFKIFDLE